jgi:hypothetical protein
MADSTEGRAEDVINKCGLGLLTVWGMPTQRVPALVISNPAIPYH